MTQGPSASPENTPDEIDTTVPHSARIWNYWLGGKDNYPVDRAAGDAYQEVFPRIVDGARTARYFLIRTIRFLAAEAGIGQFLDVGTGLPTVDNTHEVAQRVDPAARIVYVDNDPLVLAHAHALLTSTPEGRTEYVDADLREPSKILAAASETLDLTRPVGLIFSGVLGHIADYEEARSIVRRLMDGLPPGSYLSLHDATDTDEEWVQAQEQYNASGAAPYHLRSPEQVAGFFDGLELVEPGVVVLPRWRPETASLGEAGEADGGSGLGGVARKPHGV